VKFFLISWLRIFLGSVEIFFGMAIENKSGLFKEFFAKH